MKCYKCESEELVLSPIWPHMHQRLILAELVMRICLNCGLKQNHYGVSSDEEYTPAEAGSLAPNAREGASD